MVTIPKRGGMSNIWELFPNNPVFFSRGLGFRNNPPWYLSLHFECKHIQTSQDMWAQFCSNLILWEVVKFLSNCQIQTQSPSSLIQKLCSCHINTTWTSKSSSWWPSPAGITGVQLAQSGPADISGWDWSVNILSFLPGCFDTFLSCYCRWGWVINWD